jgi:hypothetical protein
MTCYGLPLIYFLRTKIGFLQKTTYRINRVRARGASEPYLFWFQNNCRSHLYWAGCRLGGNRAGIFSRTTPAPAAISRRLLLVKAVFKSEIIRIEFFDSRFHGPATKVSGQ